MAGARTDSSWMILRRYLSLFSSRWPGRLLRWRWPMWHRLRVSWAVLVRGGSVRQPRLAGAEPPAGASSPAN